MNLRTTAITVIPVVIAATVVSVFVAQQSGSANSHKMRGEFGISEAVAYRPEGARPGIRVTTELLGSDHEFPLELDVWLMKPVRDRFELADAAVRSIRSEGSSEREPSEQPAFAQNPPKDADARILLLKLDAGRHFVDFYLRARDDDVTPESGLQLLKSDDSIRIVTVGEH